MAWAAGPRADFTEFYRADIPAGQGHWHYNADVEVKLDPAAPLPRTLFIRYLGDPGVNTVRIYAHCVRDSPCASTPVVITHAWREADERRTHTVRLEGPGTYDVEIAADPTDESIEIAVPGGRD
jgi:hypothetical protein